MYIWTIPATENNVLSLRAKGENGAMTTMMTTTTMTMTDDDDDDDNDRGIARAYRLYSRPINY